MATTFPLMPASSHLDVSCSDGVVSVSGDVDLVTAPRLERAMVDAIQHAPDGIVLDLTGVEFFSSAGVTAIETVAERRPGAVRVVIAPSPRVRRTLDLLGVTSLVPVSNT